MDCFIKNLNCEHCNCEFNRTRLSKHKIHYTNKKESIKIDTNKIDTYDFDKTETIDDIIDILALYRTVLVGCSICGEICLFLNKLKVLGLGNHPEQQIETKTSSSNQYRTEYSPVEEK